MEQKQTDEILEIDAPAEIINSNCERVTVNEEFCGLLGYSKERLLSLSIWDTTVGDDANSGRIFEKILNGESKEIKITVERKNGDLLDVDVLLKPVEVKGEAHVMSIVNNVEEIDNSAISKTPDASVFEEISPTELDEIVQNIRVEAPDGAMNLGAIMLDLAAGHNEIEQYKKGALSLHQAIDERLKEEEKRNPDSIECEVLEEVKRSAFGLYLRIQRGDEELHGERDGRYSGYFN